METRLRLLLVRAGLPRPQAQAELRDERGHLVARADLYYPSHRLAIEYGGGTHRERLVADNRRQNRLLAAGFRLLRFTAADLDARPDAIVRAALDTRLPAQYGVAILLRDVPAPAGGRRR